MNLITLAAALVLANEFSGGDSNLAASISYTTVDRSGNILSVNLSSNDPVYYPYYGREYFYYQDRHYYRHYRPRTIFVEPRPIYVVHEPIFYEEPVFYYEPVPIRLVKYKSKPKFDRRTVVVHDPVVIFRDRDDDARDYDRDYYRKDRSYDRDSGFYADTRQRVQVEVRHDSKARVQSGSKSKGSSGYVRVQSGSKSKGSAGNKDRVQSGSKSKGSDGHKGKSGNRGNSGSKGKGRKG